MRSGRRSPPTRILRRPLALAGSRIGGTGLRRRFRKIVSGELAAKLTGRYVEFDMFTLGFGECLQMKRHLGQAFENDAREFETWLREGGFPVRWASPIRRRRTPTPGTSSTRMPRAQYGRQAELWAVIEERAVHAPAVEGLFGWRGANRQARVRLHRPQRRRARLRAGVDDSCGFEGRGARVCAVLENTRRMAAPPVHLGSFAKPTRRRAPPESHGIPEGGGDLF